MAQDQRSAWSVHELQMGLRPAVRSVDLEDHPQRVCRHRRAPALWRTGDAADPAADVDVALTVGADGVVRDVTATWGGDGGTWTYRVAYSDLGATPAPTAPADARPLLRDR